jgi:alcohol dehydrogenase class IV
MGYSLTYFRDIDHGRANGLLLAEFFKLVQRSCPEKIQQILTLMGCESVEHFEKIINELLGKKEEMTLEEVEKFASIAIKAKNISNCIVVPTQDDLLNIYKIVFSV